MEMKKEIWFTAVLLGLFVASHGQDAELVLKLPKSQELLLPAQTANRIGCGKWKIREVRIDSVSMDNDTLHLFINRGGAVLVNNYPHNPNMYVWEIPLQLFHTGEKLIFTNHFDSYSLKTIVIQLEWGLYVFRKKNKSSFVYVSQSFKPTPTPEEIINKNIPVRYDFPSPFPK